MYLYDLTAYGDMIADEGRVSAYAEALRATAKGAVVLDIGTGPGILALLACKAGAARVYAVEPNDAIHVARELAAANGFADRIEFIQAMSTDIQLPERVDVIVSDIRGVLPMLENSLVSIVDARQRFLKTGGCLIPARDTINAALVSCPSLHRRMLGGWNVHEGVDLSTVRPRAASGWRGHRFTRDQIVSDAGVLATVDYRVVEETGVSGEVSWTVSRPAIAHGICAWVDIELMAGIELSNSPTSGAAHIYRHAFFPWPDAVVLSPGDRVTTDMHADLINGNYIWRWNTDIVQADSTTIRYWQSSIGSVVSSLNQLRKRAHTYVPQPTENACIDRRILELMQHRGLAVGQIADRILDEFPGRIRDWNMALTRVGDLADRYCK